jgi:hypothetical protein
MARKQRAYNYYINLSQNQDILNGKRRQETYLTMQMTKTAQHDNHTWIQRNNYITGKQAPKKSKKRTPGEDGTI